jgi:hypothetical protein
MECLSAKNVLGLSHSKCNQRLIFHVIISVWFYMVLLKSVRVLDRFNTIMPRTKQSIEHHEAD